VRKAELTPKAEPVPEAKPGPENGNPLEARTYSRGELEAMRFNELRSMARRIDGFPMTRYEIREATKSNLIQGILDVQGNGGNA
jgi:hypothetical protein